GDVNVASLVRGQGCEEVSDRASGARGGVSRTESEQVPLPRVHMSFGDVDVVSLYARQVEVAEYGVEDEPAAGRTRADEDGCSGVHEYESSCKVAWSRGAGRGEDLAAPGYLTVGEKDSVVRDAGASAVVNSQPLAVVYWGHGGAEVFPPVVSLVVGDRNPYVGQAL